MQKKKSAPLKKNIKKIKPVKIGKILVKKKINKSASDKFFKEHAKKSAKKIIKKLSISRNAEVKNKRLVKNIVKKNIDNKKNISKKSVIKKVPTNKDNGFAAESLFKAKIKVIGVGGGGGSIVSEIGRSLEKATFVIADTDIRALKKKSGIKPFLFGQELTHGLGTGVNVDLAKQAAETAKEKISGFFKDQDIIIFVASLGGGLGSGATQIFAEAAKEFGGITFGIFTMPFKFEGQNKYRIAQNALKSLRQSLNVSLVIPNEKIFKIIDASTPITNAFSTVNKNLMESLESLIDLIYNPGVINIDFADLRAVLKGRGNSAFLNTVEASGKDRVQKICESIFKNPLLQGNSFVAEKILFNIAGSDNLSMFEVEKISSYIAQTNQKTKIIFGISKDQRLNNKIKTTILMTGGNLDEKNEESIKKIANIGKIEKTKAIIDKKVLENKKPIKILKTEKEIEKKEVKKINVVSGKASAKAEKKLKKDIKKEKKDFSPDKKIILDNKPSEKKTEKEIEKKEKESKEIALPEIKVPISVPTSVLEQKLDMKAAAEESSKKGIRRSGLEIKKAEEQEEKRRNEQEKEWEIPAFLRKVKFKG